MPGAVQRSGPESCRSRTDSSFVFLHLFDGQKEIESDNGARFSSGPHVLGWACRYKPVASFVMFIKITLFLRPGTHFLFRPVVAGFLPIT